MPLDSGVSDPLQADLELKPRSRQSSPLLPSHLSCHSHHLCAERNGAQPATILFPMRRSHYTTYMQGTGQSASQLWPVCGVITCRLQVSFAWHHTVSPGRHSTASFPTLCNGPSLSFSRFLDVARAEAGEACCKGNLTPSFRLPSCTIIWV